MFEEGHALRGEVPEEGCVMDPAVLGDGLSIAAKLGVTQHVVCRHQQHNQIRPAYSGFPGNHTSAETMMI